MGGHSDERIPWGGRGGGTLMRGHLGGGHSDERTPGGGTLMRGHLGGGGVTLMKGHMGEGGTLMRGLLGGGGGHSDERTPWGGGHSDERTLVMSHEMFSQNHVGGCCCPEVAYWVAGSNPLRGMFHH